MNVSELKKSPNHGVINALKILLKDAEEGKLRSFVSVNQYLAGELGQMYAFDNKCNDYALIGCMQALIIRLSDIAIQRSEEVFNEEEE
jgi:hypothetical protein